MFALPTNRAQGQSMIALVLLISFFVVGAVGLFGFEVNRVTLAREQLRAACDAAALSAAAALASSDNVDPVDAHNQAMAMALGSFQQNSVLGVPLSSAAYATGDEDVPTSGGSSVYVQFLDPHNSNNPVELGDPAGKVVKITAAYSVEPAFGRFLGISNVPVRVESAGGVPNLDVVLCFDISGSIDDQTPVTFVRRQWNATASPQARIDYNIIPARSGSPAGANAQGKLYDVIGPVPTGTRVNCVAPEYLSLTSQSGNRWPVYFSERPTGQTGAAPGLRGSPNTGSPPGNYSNPTMGLGNTWTFTDMVVNIDGRTTFAGLTTPDGYNFTEIGLVVEAARGNLDTSTAFTAARCDKRWPTFSPRAGYRAKYEALAKTNLHPIYDAQLAARDFFTIMNTNTDAHFGLVCFSDLGGTDPNDTYTEYNIDSNYTAGGQANFPTPQIILDPATGTTNYDDCLTHISPTVATTGTNIGDAVNKAVNQLRTRNRPGAKKAIVLFTDGMPTVGNPLSSDPWINARRAAVAAKNAGIPIYTIGLAQNPEIIPDETAILNDTNSDVNNGGMAAIAGNGGKFFLVTDVNNLRYTFESIARHLVQLVK